MCGLVPEQISTITYLLVAWLHKLHSTHHIDDGHYTWSTIHLNLSVLSMCWQNFCFIFVFCLLGKGKIQCCICFRIVLTAIKCLVNLLPLTNVSSSETMTMKFPALQFQAKGFFHINLEND